MNPHRQLAIGLGTMIAGLVALAVGVIVASHDLFVGLILLFLVPLSVSACGAVVALIGLVRQPEARSRSAIIRRIIGGAVLACVGSGFGYGALGTLSQLPDWAAGLNGAYLPESGLSFSLFAGICLLAGLGSGALIALIWWKTRRTAPVAFHP
jgi:hypothetical protein